MKMFLRQLHFLLFCLALISEVRALNTGQQADTIPYPAQLLSRYLQYPSVSGNEYDAGKFLADVCEEKGLYVTVFTDTGGIYNFAASLYPLSDGKPNIVFHHHIDVVPEGKLSEWKYPPFSGTIAEGSVWGRGAMDNKSLGVMHLCAMMRYIEKAKQTDLPYNFTMLAVSGEETGGYTGSKLIVDNYWHMMNAVLVLGEGGSGIDFMLSATHDNPIFGISIAEKTSLWLKLVLDLETLAHGSVTPSEYANSIMIDALNRINKRIPRIKFNKASRKMFREIGRIQGGFQGFVLQNMNWMIFKPIVSQIFIKDPTLHAISSNTITITSINSDKGAHNQIAQRIEATLDCRLLSNVEDAELIEEIQELIRDKRIRIEIVDRGANSYVTIPEYYFDVMKAAIRSHYKKAVVAPMFLPASADNNFFRSTGVPVYGIMPAVMTKIQLNSIHNYNEHIPVASLLNAIEVFDTFISLVIDDKKKQ